MDQHPIPQDVTGFQFKLIGTMTVKQFGYVATGVILAVVLFYTPLGGLFGIMTKIIFIPLLAGSGVFVAFVPIEGRPVDIMTSNFFKAVFSPNQYVYRKAGRQFSFSTLDLTPVVKAPTADERVNATTASVKLKEQNKKGARLQAYLQNNRDAVKNPLDQKELTMLSSLGLPPPPPKPVAGASTAAAHAKHTAPITHKTPAHPVSPSHPVASAAVTPTAPAAHHPVPTQPAPIKAPSVHPAASVSPAVSAAPVALPMEQTLIKQETALQQQLQEAKQEETTTHAPAAHQKVLTLEQHLADLHAQKQRLEQELVSLKTQLAPSSFPAQPLQQVAVHASAAPMAPALPTQPKPQASPTSPAANPAVAPVLAKPAAIPAAPQTPPPAVVPASQYAKTLAQPAAPAKVDLPKISDTPNVVVGTVKDPRGNILPNMLVEVKDKDGNPVRAFKTNALGQFASATPLAKGIYTIELDDPKKQHNFDPIQITANNQIMLPIEITSHDAREELRKQLFTN